MDTDEHSTSDRFVAYSLIHRSTAINEEFGFSIEVSLYKSNVTGLFVLEQVNVDRDGESRDSIGLSPCLLRKFMPFFDEFVRNETSDDKAEND